MEPCVCPPRYDSHWYQNGKSVAYTVIQVLFFVDYESLAPIKEKFAIYADKFDPFAQESNAMSQYLGMYFSSAFGQKQVT